MKKLNMKKIALFAIIALTAGCMQLHKIKKDMKSIICSY
jgi:hypothetical protein